MRWRQSRIQAAFDLVTRHRTIAGIEFGTARLNALNHRLAYFHGCVAKLSLDAVSTVVTRTPFDRLHGGSRNQLQHVASLEPDILHPQMARDMVRDLAEGAREIGAHQSGLVP